jgi:hypothetical protein
MKAKTKWKPVGLSAKKWRNAAHTRPHAELRLPRKPPWEQPRWTAPSGIELDSLGRPSLRP